MECSICYKNINYSTILRCSHVFCTECIDIWRSQNNSCPMCRERCVVSYRDSTERRIIINNIPGLEREIPKETGVHGLTDTEKQILERELNVNISAMTKDSFSGRGIVIYSNNILYIGDVDFNPEVTMLKNCIVVQRENGKSYEAFPRFRNIPNTPMAYKI